MNGIHLLSQPEVRPGRAGIRLLISSRLPPLATKIPASVILTFPLFLSACASLGTFQDMDTNHDGAVSREEASDSAPLTELFNSADDNDDGVLDEHEYLLVHQVITQRPESGTGAQKRRKMMTEKGGP